MGTAAIAARTEAKGVLDRVHWTLLDARRGPDLTEERRTELAEISGWLQIALSQYGRDHDRDRLITERGRDYLKKIGVDPLHW